MSGLLVGAVLFGVGSAAAQAGSRKAPAWIPVRSLATDYQFGELPTRAKQHVLGRLKLEHVVRVSSVRIHGKTITGDLLVIRGKYQNLAPEASYWTAGYAFTFGTSPKLCTIDLCGVTPKGAWWQLTHAFGAPIVDFPRKRSVPSKATVSFREAIPLPPGSSGADPGAAPGTKSTVIRTLGDIWLLPIYAAFNYYEQPFPRSQLVQLSAYFGQTAISRA